MRQSILLAAGLAATALAQVDVSVCLMVNIPTSRSCTDGFYVSPSGVYYSISCYGSIDGGAYAQRQIGSFDDCLGLCHGDANCNYVDFTYDGTVCTLYRAPAIPGVGDDIIATKLYRNPCLTTTTRATSSRATTRSTTSSSSSSSSSTTESTTESTTSSTPSVIYDPYPPSTTSVATDNKGWNAWKVKTSTSSSTTSEATTTSEWSDWENETTTSAAWNEWEHETSVPSTSTKVHGGHPRPEHVTVTVPEVPESTWSAWNDDSSDSTATWAVWTDDSAVSTATWSEWNEASSVPSESWSAWNEASTASTGSWSVWNEASTVSTASWSVWTEASSVSSAAWSAWTEGSAAPTESWSEWNSAASASDSGSPNWSAWATATSAASGSKVTGPSEVDSYPGAPEDIKVWKGTAIRSADVGGFVAIVAFAVGAAIFHL